MDVRLLNILGYCIFVKHPQIIEGIPSGILASFGYIFLQQTLATCELAVAGVGSM